MLNNKNLEKLYYYLLLPRFIENKMLFPEGNAIKYIVRHQDKGKKQDILKAIHFLEMIIERDYS